MSKIFNDENFNQEVIEVSKTKPVLVDFFALWCGPCKMLAPIVDQLAEELEEGAVVGKLNVEESAKIPEEYGVMSVPTLLIFKDGKVAATLAGLQSKDSLTAEIKKYL